MIIIRLAPFGCFLCENKYVSMENVKAHVEAVHEDWEYSLELGKWRFYFSISGKVISVLIRLEGECLSLIVGVLTYPLTQTFRAFLALI